MISSMLSSTPLLPPPVLSSVWSGSLCLWIEISAYSLVQAQVCAKPLSVLVTSPAGSLASVAGSDHLISNGPDFLLCNRTVFGESELAFTRATITTSEGPPANQWCSLFPTPSTATLNGEASESVANMLLVMERVRELLAAHKAAAAWASDGSAQTISTELPPAASIAVKNGEGVADVRASNLRMTGLFSACSAIHAASWRQPSA